MIPNLRGASLKTMEEEIINRLKSVYNMVSEIILFVYSVDKDFASRSGKSFEKYEYGYVIKTIKKSAEAVSTLVSFLNNYIEGIVKGLKFFSNLVFALGIKRYYEIFSQKNKLEEFIHFADIDLDFLKFQVRTTGEFIFPELERITVKVYNKFWQLREVSDFFCSDIIDRFIEVVEKQKSHWDKIRKEISLHFSIVEKEKDISTCVHQVKKIINKFIKFGVKFRELADYLNLNLGGRLEFSTKNIKKISEIIKQLNHDISIIVYCRMKATEYFANSFTQILTMLWGSEENARQKFQSFIRSEISLEDLIPQNFSLEDLEFGLVQARNDFLLADRAFKRVEENVEAMRLAAEYLNSPVLWERYEIIVKEIEIINKYWLKYTQNLIELQHLLREKSNIKIKKK